MKPWAAKDDYYRGRRQPTKNTWPEPEIGMSTESAFVQFPGKKHIAATIGIEAIVVEFRI